MRYKRWHVLYNLILQNDYKTFIEIGVAGGRTSKYLLDNLSDIKIFCVDPYEIYDNYVDKRYNAYCDIKSVFDLAAKNVFSDSRCVFYKEFSSDAVKHFDSESIDIVFIDANHGYEWVKKDIELWYPIVRRGGIISGHDFKKRYDCGVIRAVREFSRNNKLKLGLLQDTVWWIKKI